MKWATVEQAKSIKIVDQGVDVNPVKIVLAPLPAWLRSRLPSHTMHVFSASELDAIALSAVSAKGI
jgi:hypothetical protein